MITILLISTSSEKITGKIVANKKIIHIILSLSDSNTRKFYLVSSLSAGDKIKLFYMENPILTKEFALCFQWKLKARVKSRNDIYLVKRILYKDNKLIWYEVNWYYYRNDEKRQWWGRIEDIEIIY